MVAFGLTRPHGGMGFDETLHPRGRGGRFVERAGDDPGQLDLAGVDTGLGSFFHVDCDSVVEAVPDRAVNGMQFTRPYGGWQDAGPGVMRSLVGGLLADGPFNATIVHFDDDFGAYRRANVRVERLADDRVWVSQGSRRAVLDIGDVYSVTV